MVVSHDKERQGVRIDVDGMIYPEAENGTRVMIVSDEAEDKAPGIRDVRVRIADGPLKDRSGKLTRHDLRPE